MSIYYIHILYNVLHRLQVIACPIIVMTVVPYCTKACRQTVQPEVGLTEFFYYNIL